MVSNFMTAMNNELGRIGKDDFMAQLEFLLKCVFLTTLSIAKIV